MRIPGLHPTQKRLQRWLAGDEPSLDRHLATCERCADRLEVLDADEGGSIRSALMHLLVVPEELPDRLQTTIDKRLHDQRDWLLIGEFFGLPLRTVRALSSPEQGESED